MPTPYFDYLFQVTLSHNSKKSPKGAVYKEWPLLLLDAALEWGGVFMGGTSAPTVAKTTYYEQPVREGQNVYSCK